MAHVRSVREDQVAVSYLGRGKANALNAELVDELLAAVEQAANDPGVRALVVASDLPRVFCAGSGRRSKRRSSAPSTPGLSPRRAPAAARSRTS
jgi:enoyl-CoA hydratase/carnithine racemase